MDPNLLNRIAEAVLRDGVTDRAPTAEQLFVYIYGVLSGSDFTKRFEVELETPGLRIPLTADGALFDRMAEHGRRLIWIDTFAERFHEEFGESLPAMADVVWRPEPSEGPESTGDVIYNPSAFMLGVGDGMLLGVRPDVAAFEVSGMNVLDKWLGYRTLKGTGRSASSANPLDRMRHERWMPEWSRELRELVIVLSEHLLMQRGGALLLEEILAGPLIMASDLPEVDARWRQAPSSNEDLGGLFGIAAEE
jgi:hypothetical protein